MTQLYSPPLSAAELRKQLRQARNALSAEQQQQHALQACQHLLNHFPLDKPCKMGVFLSQDGELGTQPLIAALWQKPQLQLYLPALETLPDWHMGFSHYTPETPMKNNTFGIPEPDIPLEAHLAGEALDIVIMPLVGFDRMGNRMGMGGGYYDRTFAFKLQQTDSRPLLIGWAHSCQQVEKLDSQPWDVPLDAIITEKGLLIFRLTTA